MAEDPANEPVTAPPPSFSWLALATLSLALLLSLYEGSLRYEQLGWGAGEGLGLQLLVLGGVLFSANLWALLPLVLGGWLLSVRWPRPACWIHGSGAALTCAVLALDSRWAALTGQRLSGLAHFLADEAPLEWAGRGAGDEALGGVLFLAGVFCLGVLCLWACRVVWARRANSATRVWPWVVLILAGLLLPPLSSGCLVRSITLERLVAELLFEPPLLQRAEALDGEESLYAALRADLAGVVVRPPGGSSTPMLEPPAQTEGEASRRPDLIVVVLESFRYDSVDPRWMPRLSEWVQHHGRQSPLHFSSANCSHKGLFSLLYGQSSLSYDRTLDAGGPAQLSHVLGKAGYRRLLLSSSHFEWERMDRYMSTLNFDEVHIERDGSWPQRDRKILTRLRQALKPSGRQPVLAFVFLMSTHFDYSSPLEYQRHQPAEASLDWMALRVSGAPSPAERQRWLNRYRNTLAFMDDLLGDLLADLGQLGGEASPAFLITGDHGESFYEDEAWLHNARLSDQQTRVPLLLSREFGATPASLTTHLDLAPSLLHVAFGRAVPSPSFHGRDLLAEGSPSYPFFLTGSAPETVFVTPQGRLSIAFKRQGLTPLGLVDRDQNYEPLRPRSLAEYQQWQSSLLGRLARVLPAQVERLGD